MIIYNLILSHTWVEHYILDLYYYYGMIRFFIMASLVLEKLIATRITNHLYRIFFDTIQNILLHNRHQVRYHKMKMAFIDLYCVHFL